MSQRLHMVVPGILVIVAAALALNGCLFNNGCYTDCAPPDDMPPQSTCSSVKRQCSPDAKSILLCVEDGGWQVAEMCSTGTLCRTTNVGVTCLPVSKDASLADDGAAGNR